MYSIGICDDGINICSFIETEILRYVEKQKIKATVEVWNSGEALQNYLQKGNSLDILFLDIELFEMSGIELGDYIRNQLENRNMQIIYISGKSSYAQSLFKTQPMDFLVKPIKGEQIIEELNLAMKILEKNKTRFEFQVGKEYYYIPYNEIMYLYSTSRIVKIIKYINDEGCINFPLEMDAGVEFYGKLKDIIKDLPDEFVVIHQSYIVNMKFVVKYTYEEVELVNGIKLSISKSHRKAVRQKLLQGE